MSKVYIIAEVGVNHNGKLDLAMKLIDVAKDCGADAVKFQTFKAESLVTAYAEKADYQKANDAASTSQLDMLKRLELSFEDHFKLKEYCAKKQIDFMSSAFDLECLKFLIYDLKLQTIKVPSGETANYPFIYELAKSQVKAVVSTGMFEMDEIKTALAVMVKGYKNEPMDIKSLEKLSLGEISEVLKDKISLLHCTTAYPCRPEDANIRVVETFKNVFKVPVGFSDHTQGFTGSLAAVSLGAKVIEKHITLDCNMEGPDHKASLDPVRFKEYVSLIRETEKVLGSSEKKPTDEELKNRVFARKSVVAKRSIKAGEAFNEQNIDLKRPGNGLSSLYYWDIMGKKAQRDLNKDEMILSKDINGF